MKYKLIYSAANYLEADFIKGLLEQESIATLISGEQFSTLYPFGVNILVNEELFSKASEIIAKYEQVNTDTAGTSIPEEKEWKCNKCNSLNPETFGTCWQCQSNSLLIE